MQDHIVSRVQSGSVALVGIQMQFQAAVGRNTHEHVMKQDLMGGGGDGGSIPVFEAEAAGVLGCHVKMAPRTDDPAVQRDDRPRSRDDDAGRPLEITRFA
jgi:hypothetical protein